MKKELLKIPDEFDTIPKKLQYLRKESKREQELDRMDMDYCFQLHYTIEYYKDLLTNNGVSENKKKRFINKNKHKKILKNEIIEMLNNKEYKMSKDDLIDMWLHLNKL